MKFEIKRLVIAWGGWRGFGKSRCSIFESLAPGFLLESEEVLLKLGLVSFYLRKDAQVKTVRGELVGCV